MRTTGGRVRTRDEMAAVDAAPPPSSSSMASPSWSTRHKRKSSLHFLTAAVISTVFLEIPAASAADMIDLLHTKPSFAAAADNPNYISSLGLTCADHSELVCDKMGALGYNRFEVDDLLQSCPQSCATSSYHPFEGNFRQGRDKKNAYRLNNNDDDDDDDGDNNDDDRLAGLSRGHARPYTIDNNRRQRPPSLATADQTCFDGYCQDDLGYRSKIGLPCERFEIFDCMQFAQVGFTSEETDELLNSCPCACKKECSFSRTAKITPTKSPTDVPSSLPSIFPTSAPTLSLSASPSSLPSSSPTISMKPTLGSMVIGVSGTEFELTLAFISKYIEEKDVVSLGKALSTVISPLVLINGPEGTSVSLKVDLMAQEFEKSDWALTLRLAGRFSVSIPPFNGGDYSTQSMIPTLSTVNDATRHALEDGFLKKAFLEELREVGPAAFAFVADLSFEGFYNPPPTMTPTTGPPSRTPTKSPTVAPSSSPTPAPSEAPTVSPTASPTMHPTSEPSPSPTTPLPTAHPTETPKTCESAGGRCGMLGTLPCCPGDRCVLVQGFGGRCLWVKPTPSPTPEPSATPTKSPSSTPSFRPSSKPSAHPSATPSYTPTRGPTARPSMQPTGSPSYSPSSSPSDRPSPAPVTSAPSNRPTFCVPAGDLCSIGRNADPCCNRHKCTQIRGIGARCIYVESLDTDEPTQSPTTQRPTAAPTRDEPVTRSPTVPMSAAPTQIPILSLDQIDWVGLDDKKGSGQGAANRNDPDEVDLLHVENSGGGGDSIAPANQLSTPDTSGIEENPDSFMNKMAKSTNALFLAIYIAVAVSCLLITAAVTYYIFAKPLREEREIKRAAKKAKRHLRKEERESGSIGDGIEHSISSMTTGSLVAKIKESGLDKIERPPPFRQNGRDRSRERDRSKIKESGLDKIEPHPPFWQNGRDRSRERGRRRSRERDRSKEKEQRRRERRFQAAAVEMSDSLSLEDEYMDGLYSDEEYGSGSLTTASSFKRKRTPNFSAWKKIGGTGRGGALF